MSSLIEWLNTNVGTEAATYISLILGVIALLFVTSKIYKKHNQKLIVKNGTGIQAGRNVKLNEKRK